MSSSYLLDGKRIRIAGDTNTGRKRAHNEDCLHIAEEERLIMVADGMGGHACGDVASRMAVETVVQFFRETVDDPDLTWPFRIDHDSHRHENRLITGIKLANLNIFEASQRDSHFQGMGTTVVAGLFCGDTLVVAHVGDSRLYRIRGREIRQLTEDHSLLNDYIKMKRIRPEDAATFPHKNVIVRALGMKDVVAVDTLREKPEVGDVYLFCSDGLSGMLSDEVLNETVQRERDLDQCCLSLIEQANANGGNDNITIALARIDPL